MPMIGSRPAPSNAWSDSSSLYNAKKLQWGNYDSIAFQIIWLCTLYEFPGVSGLEAHVGRQSAQLVLEPSNICSRLTETVCCATE